MAKFLNNVKLKDNNLTAKRNIYNSFMYADD